MSTTIPQPPERTAAAAELADEEVGRAADGNGFAGLQLFPRHGPQPCPGLRVPLPEHVAVDESFDVQRLVCVAGSPVSAAVTRDDQFGDRPAVAAEGELGLVDAQPGPAAVQEQPVVLDEGEPPVVHIARSVTSAARDGRPYLRPSSGEFRNRDGKRPDVAPHQGEVTMGGWCV